MRLLHIHKTGSSLRLILASGLALACLSIAASSADAASITTFKNSLQSTTARKEIKQYSGKANCDRGGSKKSFRLEVGKRTKECAFRVPFVGRNVGITATGRLFKSTPKKVKSQAYLSVSVRQDTDGSRYQLCVFPSGHRFQLRKIFPNGKIQNLENGKAGKKIAGFSEANRLTLRAYNDQQGNPSGSAGIVASVNGHRLAAVVDPRGNSLEGQDTTFSIGSKKSARGARGSFVKLSGTQPDPF
ncbi:MAG: hypothetical protein JJE13_12495 [Thermoleophilia bacterium]|nr:hypothetical protein [Thermoleophilia bacterium]